MSKTTKTAAKAPKADAAPRARKEGLRTAQVRILEALAKSKAPLTKGQINESCAKAGFETAKKFSQWMADPLGSRNPEVSRAAEERSGYKSLLTLKLVKHHEVTVEEGMAPEHRYEITALGRKALEKARAEAKSAKSAK